MQDIRKHKKWAPKHMDEPNMFPVLSIAPAAAAQWESTGRITNERFRILSGGYNAE